MRRWVCVLVGFLVHGGCAWASLSPGDRRGWLIDSLLARQVARESEVRMTVLGMVVFLVVLLLLYGGLLSLARWRQRQQQGPRDAWRR